jgi:heptosyltransferase-3
MSVARLFKMIYWSLRKDWRVFPHICTVIAGWLANLLSLRLRGLAGRGTVFIGMVEHLGDIMAAEPVSRFARWRYPGAKVVWVARTPYAAIPGRFLAVDAAVGVTCLTEWLLLRASGIGGTTLDLHINQRYCPRCQIQIQKSGPAAAINPETYYRSGNLLAVQCLSADIPVLTDGPEFPSDATAAREVAALDLPARLVVIHCASNEASRDWPRENWLALVDQLATMSGISIAEIGLHAVAITEDRAGKRNLCGRLSLPQTAEVMRRAVLFIGIDSGPAHLANAVGVPGIILLSNYKGFGDYMPYSGRYADGQGADIVRTEGPMDTLPVAPVLAAARRRLGLSAP